MQPAIDDRATIDPAPPAFMGATQCFIDSQTPVTLVRIVVFEFLDRQLVDRLERPFGAGVGDQDVEACEAVDGRLHRCGKGRFVGCLGHAASDLAQRLETREGGF